MIKEKTYTQYLLILVSLILVNCTPTSNCPENINTLPMYGLVKKCNEQIKIDEDFIRQSDSLFNNNRTNASVYHVDLAWGYYYKKEYDNAIKRFNQAWLLDSTNADIYWGFGSVLGMKSMFKESMAYLKKSIKLNPKNEKVYIAIGLSYGNEFYQNKNTATLDTAIFYFKKSIETQPNNSDAYIKLTSCYAYCMQTDSVKKYLKITDSLYPNSIAPDVRTVIQNGINYSDSMKFNSKSITQ